MSMFGKKHGLGEYFQAQLSMEDNNRIGVLVDLGHGRGYHAIEDVVAAGYEMMAVVQEDRRNFGIFKRDHGGEIEMVY